MGGQGIRRPAVAGQFYNADREGLRKQVGRYIVPGAEKRKAIGIVSPHAGLMYSGPVAGAVYSSIEIPDTVLLLGPNHTGLGAGASLMSSGEWVVPTGTFPIDEELARELLDKIDPLSDSSGAHLYEHSLEVQLPFIGFFRDDVRIVPITLMPLPLEECIKIARGIAGVIPSSGKDILIVASSDMSHYVSDEVAREKDKLAIDEMLNLDAEGLYGIVRKRGISMCGYVPATIMLAASKSLGARTAELIKYATSAEVSGDYGHVVGYAGVIIR
jgi:AmmeMemoRadiSam system protein B